MSYRKQNIRNIFKSKMPVYVVKETRDGFTSNTNLVAKEDGHTILFIIPHKGVYDEIVEDFPELEATYIGSNESYCNQVIKSDMPFATKRESCKSCKEFYKGSCLIPQMIDSLSVGNKHNLFMSYHKFVNLREESMLWEILDEYVDYFIFDECFDLVYNNEIDLNWEDISYTGIDEIDKITSQCRWIQIGEFIEREEKFESWYDLYQLEEETNANSQKGTMLTLFNGTKFERTKNGIRIYKDQTNFFELFDKIKSRSILGEANRNYKKLSKHLNVKLNVYKWVKPVRYGKHFILVDGMKFDYRTLENKVQKIKEFGENPLVVFKGKKDHNKHANGFYSTYYRSKKTKGVQEKLTRFMVLVDLPHLPNNVNDRKEKMQRDFKQTIDRVKDGSGQEYSYVYVMNATIEDIEQYYDGEARIIPLVKNSFNNLETIINLVQYSNIPLDEISIIARIIDGVVPPSSTAKYCGRMDLLEKHRDFILQLRNKRSRKTERKKR